MVLVLRRLFNTLRCQGRAKKLQSSSASTQPTTGIFPPLKRWKAQEKKSLEDIPRLGMVPRGQVEEDVDTLIMLMTMTPQPGKIQQFKDDGADTIPELQATGSFSDDSTISEQSFSSMSEYSNEDSYFIPKRKERPSMKCVTFLLPDWDVSSKSFLQPTRCGSLMLGVMPQIDEEASDCCVTDSLPEIPNDEEESLFFCEKAALAHEEPPSNCINSKEMAGCLRNSKDMLPEKQSPWVHLVGSMPDTTQDSCDDIVDNESHCDRYAPYEDDDYPSDEEDGMDEDADDDDEEEETNRPAMAPVVISQSLATGRVSGPILHEEYDDCPFDEISDRLQVELFR